ncbi:MAG: PilZ domain-containing protein, partial [Fimbriimonadales bacterium]|nr:PilZ domain-containing protein [Fimbriimonadales bacterium]
MGLALLGGLIIALSGRRWRLCPSSACPALEAGQRIEFTLAGERYATVLRAWDGETLYLVPPLRRGIPYAIEPGCIAEVRLTTPEGVYEAPIQFTGRQTHPEPLLIARPMRRWKHIQRRRHERVCLPDEVNVALALAGEQWIGWVRDVSVGGMRLIVPTPLPENAQVRLELPSTLRGLTDSDAERLARVVACERAPTRHGYAYQLRLAF